MLQIHVGLCNSLQTFSLKQLKQKVIYKGNYFLLSQTYAQVRMSTHLLPGKTWKRDRGHAPCHQCRMLCSHIPEWVENRMVFLMQIVNFSLELDSKLRCWKPEYSRVVLTHVGTQICRYKESARRDLVLFWPRLCETGMEILENNYTWAFQADGEPLRNTNVEDILRLEFLFRAHTHGPQPIIIPSTLTENTFSESDIKSLLS